LKRDIEQLNVAHLPKERWRPDVETRNSRVSRESQAVMRDEGQEEAEK
jgi:hypothetical protein